MQPTTRPAASPAPALSPAVAQPPPDAAAAADRKAAAAAAAAPAAISEGLIGRVRTAFVTFEHRFNVALLTKRESEGKDLRNRDYAVSAASLFFSLALLLKNVLPEKKPQFLKAIGVEGMSEADFHAAASALRDRVIIPLHPDYSSECLIESTYQTNRTYKSQFYNESDAKATRDRELQELSQKPVKVTGRSLGLDFINTMGLLEGGIPVDPEWIKLVEGPFKGKVYVSKEPAKALNEFIKDRTHGLLPEFFDSKKWKDQDVRLLACLAVLVAPWEDAFEFGHVTKGNFKLAHGVVPNALILHETATGAKSVAFRGKLDGDRTAPFDLFVKDYKYPGLSRVIVVPHDSSKLSEVEKTLTLEKLLACIKIAQENVGKRKAAGGSLMVKVSWPMKKTFGDFSNKVVALLEAMDFPIKHLKDGDIFSGINFQTRVIDTHEGTVAVACAGSMTLPLCGHSGNETFIFNAARPHFDIVMLDNMPIFRTHIEDGSALIIKTDAEWRQLQARG